MDSLDSAHQSPEFYLRRSSLQRIKNEKPFFEQLMGMTNQCMRNNPQLEGNVEGAIACEHIHPETRRELDNPSLKNQMDYNFHTHPNGEIDYPSDTDIETTIKMKKDWILIGVARKNKVVAYHKSDGFTEKVAEF